MPILTRTLRTRGYELDQDGRIPPVAYLRYMEHLRWELLDDGAVNVAHLFEDSHMMVVVAQKLQLERELNARVALSVSVGIGQVGRSSLEFRHLFRLGDQTVARGTVAAVFLGPDRRPAPLPDVFREQALAQLEQDWADGGELAAPEPPRGDPPEGAWHRRIEVRPSDLDLLRHVNHANYLAYAEDTRLLCAKAGGYGEGSALEGRAEALAVEYIQQAVQGDRLDLWTWSESDRVAHVVLARGGERRPLFRASLHLAT